MRKSRIQPCSFRARESVTLRRFKILSKEYLCYYTVNFLHSHKKYEKSIPSLQNENPAFCAGFFIILRSKLLSPRLLACLINAIITASFCYELINKFEAS